VIQVTPQMRVLVAIEPVDFRRGIDGMASACRERLAANPFSGAAYVFRNRRGTAVKVLVYDGQGFWLCHKRLSTGRFRCWPAAAGGVSATIRAHELQVLLVAGDPARTQAPPEWRSVSPASWEPKSPPLSEI
jgi:transposase